MLKRNLRPALVLDAHLKSSLAAIRSLGNKGIPVIAGAERATAMGLHSRFSSETFVYPSPLLDRAGFVESVRRAAERSGARPVLYTFSDATMIPLLEAWRRLSGHALAVLPADPCSVDTAFDKVRTFELAARLGIETPATTVIDSLPALDGLALSYPVVIKARRSATWDGNSGVQTLVSFAFTAEEARRRCEKIFRRTGELPFIQEYIQGEELGVEFLCREGKPLAACAHRRIRSVSPTGGAAVVKETVPETYLCIGTYARRLVSELRWSGPIMIEFKVDRRDGRAKLLEINGRFWGSLPLAVFAGVDFPYLYYRMAEGQSVPESYGYREGIRSRHWAGDFRHLLAVFFARDPLRPIAYPRRARALREFLFTAGPLYYDVASARDPGPAVMEVVDYLCRHFTGCRLHRFAHGALDRFAGTRGTAQDQS